MTQPEDMALRVRRDIAASLLLVLLVAAVFGQAVGFDFVYFDDAEYVQDNPQVQAGLTVAGVRWAFTAIYAANWHPLTWLSHMADVTLWGPAPAGHHFTSIVLHAGAAVLFYLFLVRATGRAGPALVAAALFAVHPTRAESVAWVAERKDVLCAFLWMLTLCVYRVYVRRPHPGRMALVTLCFALALMAKPMAVTLPFVLLLLDYWPFARVGTGGAAAWDRAWRLVAEKAPLFVLVAGACAITLLAQQEAMGSIERFTLAHRVGNALVAYVRYLGMCVWPRGLAAFYPYTAHPPGTVAASALLLAVLSGVCLALWRSRPWLLVGWLWFLGTLVPVIGLVQVGGQSMADRYTYLPFVGLFMAFAWSAAGFLRGRTRLAAALAGVLVAVLAASAWVQTGYWRDGVTLWRRVLAVTPETFKARRALGGALLEQGDAEAARTHFDRLLEIDPGNADAWFTAGAARDRLGRPGEAVRYYDEAIARDPGHVPALVSRAALALAQGNPVAALPLLERALDERPGHARARVNLGIALGALGRWDDAVSVLEDVRAAYPADAEAAYNLGLVYLMREEPAAALAHFEAAVRNAPDDVAAHHGRAVALEQLGRTAEARDAYGEVLRLAPNHREARAARERLGADSP